MKILFVFRSPIGGLFRQVMDLLKGLHDRGHQVGVVCDAYSSLSATAEGLLHQYASLGLLRLPISRLPSFTDVSVAKQISRWVTQHGFDIVHGHGAKGGLYARLVAGSCREGAPKAVYTLHGGSLHYHPRSLAGFLYLSTERYLLPRTTGLIFESEFAQRRFVEAIGQPACLAQVIHNGVYESEFEPLTHLFDAADFVFLGELRRLKGVDVLLQAVHLLQTQGRATSLAIFGSGPDENSFRALAAQLGILNVQWHGVAVNAREAAKHGRCLVLPSLAESLPYVVLESVAMGVPVLATRVGGVPEILGERDSWIIPGNVMDLADKMRMFLDGDLGSVGNVEEIRTRAKLLFSLDRMVDSTLDFYAACLVPG